MESWILWNLNSPATVTVYVTSSNLKAIAAEIGELYERIRSVL